jgi:uncharacterized protein YndB with AHSA1/START domain
MTKIFDTEIIHSTLIKAPIEKVYDALTTSEGLDSWFTQGAEVDRKPGGKIHFRWKTERADVTGGIIEDGGPILEVNRPTHFAFQWHPDNKSYATTVHFKLEEDEKGTIVIVQEHGFENTPKGRKALIGCATGWGEAITMVKFYLEHGITYD